MQFNSPIRASITRGSKGWWPFLPFFSLPFAQDTARVSFVKKMSMAALIYPAQFLHAAQ